MVTLLFKLLGLCHGKIWKWQKTALLQDRMFPHPSSAPFHLHLTRPHTLCDDVHVPRPDVTAPVHFCVPLTISHPMWAPKEGYNLGRGGSLPTRAVSGRVPHSECLSLEGASGWHQSMHLCGGLCVLTRGSISTTWETAVLEPRTA